MFLDSTGASNLQNFYEGFQNRNFENQLPYRFDRSVSNLQLQILRFVLWLWPELFQCFVFMDVINWSVYT